MPDLLARKIGGVVTPRCKTPREKHWLEMAPPPTSSPELTIEIRAYQRYPMRVISELGMMDLPGTKLIGPTWHVSLGIAGGARASDAQLLHVRRAFGMLDAEEDNHHPGRARHLMMPVDPQHRVACECKTDEDQVVDPDGYRWSNAVGDTCRGCLMQVQLGRPCPLHAFVGMR